jgi:hypothetical protein
MTVAMEWVGRIIAIGLEMVLPGLGGQWCDGRFGTTPWLAIVGFVLGMTVAIIHLVAMTSPNRGAKK